MPDVLPDSRLKDPKATVMADWTLSNGHTIRLELEPIYCFNCGVPTGYVPRYIMSFVSWMCAKCSEAYGTLAANWKSSDEEFWAKVHSECLDKFGQGLTQQDLAILGDQGRLGPALEALARESPYKVWKGDGPEKIVADDPWRVDLPEDGDLVEILQLGVRGKLKIKDGGWCLANGSPYPHADKGTILWRPLKKGA